MLYEPPDLDLEDAAVLEQIHRMRSDLAEYLRTPRRWEGGLRRSTLARAIRGSNSIEGYHVELDDAAAAVDDEQPLSADERTFAEIRGYRQALGYVLVMAADPHFRIDGSAIRSMHYMMLSHDLAKGPGQYRTGPIYVHDDRTGATVYEGADAGSVPSLMDEFVDHLRGETPVDPLIRGAMAHLNLVMIHPFRDGNGRMGRALQTLVLSRGGIVEPTFSSIEEWLGSNTDDYYRVLAITGSGAWNPGHAAGLWVKFNLRAHHMQAQTLRRRFDDAGTIWEALDAISAEHSLPERMLTELFDATIGFRIRRSTYVRRAQIEERTASRDLARLVELGLLRPVGQTKGRHYLAADGLLALRRSLGRNRAPIEDPYPLMPAALLDEAPTRISSRAQPSTTTDRSPRSARGPEATSAGKAAGQRHDNRAP